MFLFSFFYFSFFFPCFLICFVFDTLIVGHLSVLFRLSYIVSMEKFSIFMKMYSKVEQQAGGGAAWCIRSSFGQSG